MEEEAFQPSVFMGGDSTMHAFLVLGETWR